ncbi:hypothetical protein FGG08_004189 [Glutinoglossum americanum]|uniref:Fe2OG dioxygenase domain-containing protein n=1 Tax=Glutinoglossum americanum TaxID=1670608 RepID=A0A9P8I9Q3_9PEZI|nr:hypothetical protein FGG08_004189 [Glutinoglossum americanum]
MASAEAPENPHASFAMACILSLPRTAYYFPSFINPALESRLLEKILSAPKPRWTTLSRRRLQTYPSRLTGTNTLIAEPLPTWLLDPIVARMQGVGIWAESPHRGPNHCLVNVYEPGQGIMPHEDGAAYWPLVATVSLGAPIVLDIFEKDAGGGRGKLVGRILQEPGSLLVTTDDLYKEHLHGIAEVTSDEDLGSPTIANWNLLGSPQDFETGRYDRQTRASLTYRDVLKVSNIGNSLKLFGKR